MIRVGSNALRAQIVRHVVALALLGLADHFEHNLGELVHHRLAEIATEAPNESDGKVRLVCDAVQVRQTVEDRSHHACWYQVLVLKNK